MSEQEKLLKQLAVAIEDIIVAQNNQPPDKRSFGKWKKDLCKNAVKMLQVLIMVCLKYLTLLNRSWRMGPFAMIIKAWKNAELLY